jgi:hypothetical protein
MVILRTLRLWMIRTERIGLPAGSLEPWYEEEYRKMTVHDRLRDSSVAYMEEDDLKKMYDMGKPPYLSKITYAGIHATKTTK